MSVYTDLDARSSLLCVICSSTILLENCVTGSRYATGQQAVACKRHIIERKNWIDTWAIFDTEQTYTLEDQRSHLTSIQVAAI